MARKTHHVVPNKKRGGWDVMKENGKRAIKHFEKRHEAISYAKEMSENQGSILVLHRKDGSVQKRIGC